MRMSKGCHGGKYVGALKYGFAALLLAFSMLHAGPAKADAITLAGSTSGSFSGLGNFTSSGLTFTGATFDTTTSAAGAGTLDLGSFNLGSSSSFYLGQFTLDVTFSLPEGVAGGGSDFTAFLLGSVYQSNGQALIIDFSPSSELFTFSDSAGSGSFSLSIPSIDVSAGSPVTLDGSVTGAIDPPPGTAPEPATLAVCIVGLAALFFFRRRELNLQTR